MEQASHNRLLKNILAVSLLPRAIEYGGYNKIPSKVVVEVSKVALVATLVIMSIEAIGGKW